MTCLGLQEVGIFRLPGSATRVNELKEAFNEGMLWSAPKPWRHMDLKARTSSSAYALGNFLLLLSH